MDLQAFKQKVTIEAALEIREILKTDSITKERREDLGHQLLDLCREMKRDGYNCDPPLTLSEAIRANLFSPYKSSTGDT